MGAVAPRPAHAGPVIALPRTRILALCAAALLAPALSARAQDAPFGGIEADPGAPVEVTAETLSIDRATGLAVFEGGVVVGQGDLRLAAERVEVEYAEESRRIARLTAEGGVTLVAGEDAAEAERAVYDVDGGEIVLSGDVLLTQGEGGAALSAETLRVDLTTGEAVLEGRVRTVLPQGD